MAKHSLRKDALATIEDAVACFRVNRALFETFAQALIVYFQNDPQLISNIHFIRHRIKDPEHLREKLLRKARDGEVITGANLFDRITDLAGVRLVHLHTEQMGEIHAAIQRIAEEQRLRFVEPPTANCWDAEYEEVFRNFGIEVRRRESMYTTVHYLIQANQRTKITCEVQVRTLMDEVWGEVSHRVNYPTESRSRTCQDQLKVLARLTTGCTRLVDSIFRTEAEALARQ